MRGCGRSDAWMLVEAGGDWSVGRQDAVVDDDRLRALRFTAVREVGCARFDCKAAASRRTPKGLERFLYFGTVLRSGGDG
jgi:hypothetical protein